MRTYLLGGVTYGTRKAVEAKCKGILHNTQPNEPIDGDDGAFLVDVLKLHPRAAEKIGTGIVAIYVVQEQCAKHFSIRRTDGTEIDFSFKKCLDSKET